MTNVLTKPKEALSTLGAHARKDSMAEKSFSELYRLHVNNVYYYLLSRVRNEADAEDLTSQTFITALEKRHRYVMLKSSPHGFTVSLAIKRMITLDVLQDDPSNP